MKRFRNFFVVVVGWALLIFTGTCAAESSPSEDARKTQHVGLFFTQNKGTAVDDLISVVEIAIQDGGVFSPASCIVLVPLSEIERSAISSLKRKGVVVRSSDLITAKVELYSLFRRVKGEKSFVMFYTPDPLSVVKGMTTLGHGENGVAFQDLTRFAEQSPDTDVWMFLDGWREAAMPVEVWQELIRSSRVHVVSACTVGMKNRSVGKSKTGKGRLVERLKHINETGSLDMLLSEGNFSGLVKELSWVTQSDPSYSEYVDGGPYVFGASLTEMQRKHRETNFEWLLRKIDEAEEGLKQQRYLEARALVRQAKKGEFESKLPLIDIEKRAERAALGGSRFLITQPEGGAETSYELQLVPVGDGAHKKLRRTGRTGEPLVLTGIEPGRYRLEVSFEDFYTASSLPEVEIEPSIQKDFRASPDFRSTSLFLTGISPQDARVTIRSAGAKTQRLDGSTRQEIVIVPNKEYVLEAKRSGYRTYKAKFSIKKGQRLVLDIKLPERNSGKQSFHSIRP